MSEFYVYHLIDPRDGDVFYVGKGKGNRLHAHFAEFRARRITNAAKFARIGEIVSSGLKPVAKIVSSGLTEADAFAHEKAMIREIGWHNLTNIVPGSLSATDRAIEWAKALIPRIKPFDEWLEDRPRSKDEVTLYHRVVAEFHAIANGIRLFEFKDDIGEASFMCR